MTIDEVKAFLVAVEAVGDAYKDKRLLKELCELVCKAEDALDLSEQYAATGEASLRDAQQAARKARDDIAKADIDKMKVGLLEKEARQRDSALSQAEAALEVRVTDANNRISARAQDSATLEKKLSNLEKKLLKRMDALDAREATAVSAQAAADAKVEALRRAVS